MKRKRLCFIGLLLVMFMIPTIYEHSSSIIESISEHKETNATSLSATTNETTTSNKIVIDAGHGGYDSGSISESGVYEKDITLSISLKVGEILSTAGYDVVYTRVSDDVSWSDNNLDDLSTRVQLAKEANASYYISIHTNASENYNDGAYGFECYLDFTDDTIIQMAQQITNNLDSLSYTQNRGLKSTEDNSLYVINKNSVPALLIELGFISDRDDANYMMDESGQENLAYAIANGILESL